MGDGETRRVRHWSDVGYRRKTRPQLGRFSLTLIIPRRHRCCKNLAAQTDLMGPLFTHGLLHFWRAIVASIESLTFHLHFRVGSLRWGGKIPVRITGRTAKEIPAARLDEPGLLLGFATRTAPLRGVPPSPSKRLTSNADQDWINVRAMSAAISRVWT